MMRRIVIIGTSKITKGWKISLLKDVRTELQVSMGDKVVFIKKNGKIIIEKA